MENLLNIQKSVFARRPVLEEILATHGQEKLLDYVKKFWQEPASSPDAGFLLSVKNIAGKLYKPDVAEKIVSQILKKPLISTIDHLGIWGHPIFVNSNIIYSLHFEPHETAVILATESVSLNNTSSWSGSVLFHQGGMLNRLSVFPDKQKTLPVFSTPAVSWENLVKFKTKAGENVFKYLEDAIDLLKPNFSQQACFASSFLWKKVFPSAPNLLFLPLETIILDYLFKILSEPRHIIYNLIFTDQGKNLWQKYFGSEHTFMFWGIDGKGRRKNLQHLPNKGELIKTMEHRLVYPSSPLCFMVLLIAGFACAGGFTQTTWLTRVKNQFISLLAEMGENETIEKIRGLPTKNYAESSLAWVLEEEGYFNPSGYDLNSLGKEMYAQFVNMASKITLEESFLLALPTIYQVVVPPGERLGEFDAKKLERQIQGKIKLF